MYFWGNALGAVTKVVKNKKMNYKFQPGHSKVGGRKQGTPNKKTSALSDILLEHNFDIPFEIIKLIPKLSAVARTKVLLELMQYIYPKRKAVEFRGSASITLADMVANSYEDLVAGSRSDKDETPSSEENLE